MCMGGEDDIAADIDIGVPVEDPSEIIPLDAAALTNGRGKRTRALTPMVGRDAFT